MCRLPYADSVATLSAYGMLFGVLRVNTFTQYEYPSDETSFRHLRSEPSSTTVMDQLQLYNCAIFVLLLAHLIVFKKKMSYCRKLIVVGVRSNVKVIVIVYFSPKLSKLWL